MALRGGKLFDLRGGKSATLAAADDEETPKKKKKGKKNKKKKAATTEEASDETATGKQAIDAAMKEKDAAEALGDAIR